LHAHFRMFRRREWGCGRYDYVDAGRSCRRDTGTMWTRGMNTGCAWPIALPIGGLLQHQPGRLYSIVSSSYNTIDRARYTERSRTEIEVIALCVRYTLSKQGAGGHDKCRPATPSALSPHTRYSRSYSFDQTYKAFFTAANTHQPSSVHFSSTAYLHPVCVLRSLGALALVLILDISHDLVDMFPTPLPRRLPTVRASSFHAHLGFGCLGL